MIVNIYLISLGRFDESAQGTEYSYEGHNFFVFNHSSQFISFDFPSLGHMNICIEMISVD